MRPGHGPYGRTATAVRERSYCSSLRVGVMTRRTLSLLEVRKRIRQVEEASLGYIQFGTKAAQIF